MSRRIDTASRVRSSAPTGFTRATEMHAQRGESKSRAASAHAPRGERAAILAGRGRATGNPYKRRERQTARENRIARRLRRARAGQHEMQELRCSRIDARTEAPVV